jgi:hypothetical protein
MCLCTATTGVSETIELTWTVTYLELERKQCEFVSIRVFLVSHKVHRQLTPRIGLSLEKPVFVQLVTELPECYGI